METKEFKTFEDLQFEQHPLGGNQARIDFNNGYGASVLLGNLFYSNGIDTYELAVFKNGHLCYDTEITDDVIGRITKDEVTEILIKIQQLEP